MMLASKSFSFSRSVSLGYLVGVFVAALLYKFHLGLFNNLMDRSSFIICGGVIGGVVGRTIDSIFSSLFRFGSFCEKLMEAEVIFRMRIMDRQKFDQVRNHLIDRRFSMPTMQQERHADRSNEQ